MRIISIIVGLVLMLGCTRASQTSTNAPVQLTPEMFNGYEFTLISKKDYEQFSFLYPGSVDVDNGQVNGGVVGSTLGWKIKDGYTLAFLSIVDPTPQGSTNEIVIPESFSLQFKSFGDDIVVTTEGQKFRRTKFKYPD